MIEVETPDGPRLYDFESLGPIGDPYPHEVSDARGPAATYAHDVDWLATNVVFDRAGGRVGDKAFGYV